MIRYEAIVGRALPNKSVEVSPEAIRLFASATDDASVTNGAKSTSVPPGFILNALPELDVPEKVMFEGARLVHNEQDVRWHAPMRAGEAISSSSRVKSLEIVEFGHILVMESRVTNARREIIAELEAQVFIVQAELASGRASRRPPIPDKVAMSVSWRVADDQPNRFAAASGDNNPIHLNDAAAKAAGFPGRILHGACTYAFAARAVVNGYLGGEAARLRRLTMGFARPVFPGDVLLCQGWEVGVRGERKRIELSITNQNEELVVHKAMAEVR